MLKKNLVESILPNSNWIAYSTSQQPINNTPDLNYSSLSHTSRPLDSSSSVWETNEAQLFGDNSKNASNIHHEAYNENTFVCIVP